jgi:hypothetical protein
VRAGLVTLLLLAAPAAGSQEADSAAGAVIAPGDQIAACIEDASGDEVGLAALESSCPGIGQALTQSGYADFISESGTEQLNSYGLADLEQIADRYRQSPREPAADVAALAPVLSTIEEELRVDRPLTLFERFERWLNGLLQRSQQDEDSWLGRWLRGFDVPERITRPILYGAIVLVILIAVAVIVNELRAAGVFRRGGRRSVATPGTVTGTGHASATMLADLDRVPAAERPALLLRMLVNTLVHTGRLRTEKSLTHRELGERAAFDATTQRQSFNRVASLSERILYSNREVSAEEIDVVVTEGRTLDHQLSLPRAAT